jgi:uncharacterized protein YbjQ (UPF0145 family)
MATQKILVTTTQNLEGWEITDYLGPVFSHIVTGTGFFSDFAAGLSDIFGGQSESYQKQLTAINSYAIESLKKKTSLLGGNLLLGLRIDHDEISGKSKQMFMVTAFGTAARGTKKISENSNSNPSLLTSDALKIALKKKEIIDKFNPQSSLTSEEWDFVTENQVHEIAPQMLSCLMMTLAKSTPDPESIQAIRDKFRKYFYAIPREKSIAALYDALKTSEIESLFPFIRNTVFEGDLFSFDAITKLLTTGEFKFQKLALMLAKSNMPIYSQEDIQKFLSLIDLVKKTFVIRAKSVEGKSMFSSPIKEEWQCECGKRNKKDRKRCSSCTRDIYGFKENEVTPDQAIKFLQNKVNVLKETFTSIDE